LLVKRDRIADSSQPDADPMGGCGRRAFSAGAGGTPRRERGRAAAREGAFRSELICRGYPALGDASAPGRVTARNSARRLQRIALQQRTERAEMDGHDFGGPRVSTEPTRFFLNWLQNPLTVGAVAPSGRE